MRPASDQRRAGGPGRPSVCPGWRPPGREVGDRRNGIAGRTQQEELPTGAVAAGGGAVQQTGGSLHSEVEKRLMLGARECGVLGPLPSGLSDEI
ncbi:hypothetical protein NDU88_006674 [Pleurodeles waltl]|uniref:Uncharacterized protein n=1 Tax=Pleurodeles waltl TaxID=8319 RepID=A0AAV7X1C0_PLEWA|nr:hypothetical protein NDU88_006674 [Pleurodeles waltl]